MTLTTDILRRYFAVVSNIMSKKRIGGYAGRQFGVFIAAVNSNSYRSKTTAKEN